MVFGNGEAIVGFPVGSVLAQCRFFSLYLTRSSPILAYPFTSYVPSRPFVDLGESVPSFE